MATPQYAMATLHSDYGYTAICYGNIYFGYNFQIFAIYDILPPPGLIFEIC
jgi:hypothetical protein